MNHALKNNLLPIIITLLLSACATLSEDECKTASWYDLGYEDGANGYQASRVGKHRSACAKYGIRPDLAAYNQGRAKGLHQYCTPANGYNSGVSGVAYTGICSGYNEAQFLSAYHIGKELFRENKQLQDMQNELYNKQEHRSDLQSQLKEKENLLVNGKLDTVNALLVLNDTYQMAKDLGALDENLHSLQAQIDEQSRHVEHLRRQNHY